VIIIAVTDANIFIDLIAIDLIADFLALDIEIHTTREVISELYDDDMNMLIDTGCIIIAEDTLTNTSGLPGLSNHFSVADRSLLTLLYQLDSAILLSGEKRMRSWCDSQKIEVHGIIWAIQTLLDHKFITAPQAANKLKLLMTINDWLPVKICLDKIVQWESSS
jgi:hypothetical protein